MVLQLRMYPLDGTCEKILFKVQLAECDGIMRAFGHWSERLWLGVEFKQTNIEFEVGVDSSGDDGIVYSFVISSHALGHTADSHHFFIAAEAFIYDDNGFLAGLDNKGCTDFFLRDDPWS